MSDQNTSTSGGHHRLILWDILLHKRSRPIALWAFAIILGGTIFYHYVEDWSWIDSIYFCFISLATVGYGDLVPTTPFSKIFTIFYIVNGLGVMLALFDIYSSLRTGRTIEVIKR